MSSLGLGSLYFLLTVINPVVRVLVTATAAHDEKVGMSGVEMGALCSYLITCCMYPYEGPEGIGGCWVGGA